MSKETVKLKRSFLRKSLMILWRIFYDAMVIVGILVFLFAMWWGYCYYTAKGSEQQPAVSIDLKKDNFFAFCSFVGKHSFRLETAGAVGVFRYQKAMFRKSTNGSSKRR